MVAFCLWGIVFCYWKTGHSMVQCNNYNESPLIIYSLSQALYNKSPNQIAFSALFPQRSRVACDYPKIHFIFIFPSSLQIKSYHLQYSSMSLSRDKNTQQQSLLEEYLRLKPSRAIDRLLSQHNIQKAHVIYHLLQQKIKKNTNELRSTLTHKYQNLVDCSNLLITIKQFTDQIQIIEKDISSVFYKTHILDEEEQVVSQKSPVRKIDELIFKKCYREAMSLSFEKFEGIDESDVFYLPFLRIQILQELQVRILSKKFSNDFIQQMVQCLKTYIVGLNDHQKEEILQNERKQGDLLSLIAEFLSTRQGSQVNNSNMIQIIFKCKLLSLNNKIQRNISEDEQIIKFFHDIYTILQNQQHSKTSNLLAIFIKNIQRIELNLYETFIIKHNNAISFRYQLYEKLIKSQQFMTILQKLSAIVTSSQSEEHKCNLYRNFINLWESYYRQLMIMIFGKINPLNNLTKSPSQNKYPRQIARYMCSTESPIQIQLKKYASQVVEFISNINQLFKKSESLKRKVSQVTNIIQEIIGLYKQQMQKINNQITSYLATILAQPSLVEFNYIIHIFMYAHQFNQLVTDHQSSNSHIHLVNTHLLEYNCSILKPFSQCFYDKGRKQSVWTINFDHFWMKYYSLQLKKLEMVKQMILYLLQGMMEGLDNKSAKQFIKGKQRQRLDKQYQRAEKKNRLRDVVHQQVKANAFAKKKIGE